MHTPINTEKGSSLLEMAVFIGFIGIMVAGVLQLSSFSRERSAIVKTNKRMDLIVKSISSYAQTRWRIPCPAELSQMTVGATKIPFGTERLDASGDPDCAVTADSYGIVPYRTLGIPEHYVKDGWGRFFTYAISPAFTNVNFLDPGVNNVHKRLAHLSGDFGIIPKLKFCGGSSAAASTDLDIKDEDNKFLLQDDSGGSLNRDASLISTIPSPSYYRNSVSTATAMVLISHGANGYGAFLGNGTTSRNLPALGIYGAEEVENADIDKNIIINSVYSKSGNAASSFDDIIIHLTQDQLYAYAGGGSCENP